jgi:hypothetical protein
MPVTVKQITLWRTEVENRAGVLAQTLKPLAEAGADLHLVMGYRYPGDESKAAIEVYPIAGKKVAAAAQASGLSGSAIPTPLVEGDNKPRVGTFRRTSDCRCGHQSEFPGSAGARQKLLGGPRL